MILLLARFLQILLSVVSIKLSSHILAPEQMGRFALANSIVAFFAFMFVNPVGMFMNRRMHTWWREGQWVGHLRWFTLYIAGVAVVAALAFTLDPSFFKGLRMSLDWMLVLICGAILVNTANQTLVSTLNLLGFAMPFAILTVLTPMLGLGLSWLLCQWLGSQTEYWLSGLLVGQVVVTIAALVVIRNRWTARTGPAPGKTRLTPELVRRLFVYSWPISIAVVLGWSQSQGYRFVMEHMIGLKELGIFVAAYGIAMGIMSAAESLLASLLQPRFYMRLNSPGDSSADAWNEYAGVALPMLVLTAGALAAASSEAVHIFLAPAYWGTATFVCWAAAVELIRTVANAYSLCMHAEMNTRRLIVPSLIGAVLSIGFLTVAARLWGLAGVGPALTLAGIPYLAAWHIAASRLSGVALPGRRLLLAVAGGLLAFGAISLIHRAGLAFGPAATIAVSVVPVVLIYLLFAAALMHPAISDRSRATPEPSPFP